MDSQGRWTELRVRNEWRKPLPSPLLWVSYLKHNAPLEGFYLRRRFPLGRVSVSKYETFSRSPRPHIGGSDR